jgi:hypothetical protein
MNRAFAFAAVLAAAPAMAQTATPLPANVQAAVAVVTQDEAALQAAMTQLRADSTSNAAAVGADRSAVEIARLKLRMDMESLHQDALPIIQADELALLNALTQLHTDQLANNAAGVTADQAAVTLAEQQLELDMTALGLHQGLEGQRRR